MNDYVEGKLNAEDFRKIRECIREEVYGVASYIAKCVFYGICFLVALAFIAS